MLLADMPKHYKIGIRTRSNRRLNERQLRRQYQMKITLMLSGEWYVEVLMPEYLKGERRRVWRYTYRAVDAARGARQAALRYRILDQSVRFVNETAEKMLAVPVERIDIQSVPKDTIIQQVEFYKEDFADSLADYAEKVQPVA